MISQLKLRWRIFITFQIKRSRLFSLYTESWDVLNRRFTQTQERSSTQRSLSSFRISRLRTHCFLRYQLDHPPARKSVFESPSNLFILFGFQSFRVEMRFQFEIEGKIISNNVFTSSSKVALSSSTDKRLFLRLNLRRVSERKSSTSSNDLEQTEIWALLLEWCENRAEWLV